MNEKHIKYGGWIISLLLISAGAWFIWPRIHINL